MRIWLGMLSIAGCHEVVRLDEADGMSPDADSDTDTDVDTDSDSDADSDVDTDTGTGPCVDDDADGHCAGEDCDDADASIHPGAAEAGVWSSEFVDLANPAAETCSLAIDADGAAHIHYIYGDRPEFEGNEFRYATNAAGEWGIASLESISAGVHLPTAMATDSGGHVHIAYQHMDGSTYTLRYRSLVDGVWNSEIIGESGAFSEAIGLALDDHDSAHIAYGSCVVGACNGAELSYATNESGAWSTEVVSDPGNTEGAAIAIAPDGSVQVTYTVGDWAGDFDVRRAVRDAGGWSDESLTDVERGSDTFLGSNCCTGLAIDEAGVAHVSIPGDDLRYMTDLGGEWSEEDLVQDGWDAFYNRLALGPRSVHTAWVAYGADGRFLDGEIHWARAEETKAGGVDWIAETIAATGEVDTKVALAVDAAGIPHVAYIDAEDDLMYAVRAPIDDGIDQDCDGHP